MRSRRSACLLVLVVLLLLPVEAAFAAGSPPTVDVGPNKILSFPAKDLTLFGHASDPENDPLTIAWTTTSGPAMVTFSAPWALATTVTFAAIGTYTFQLSVSDGTSVVTRSVTVTVNPASSQTAFYVDPSYLLGQEAERRRRRGSRLKTGILAMRRSGTRSTLPWRRMTSSSISPQERRVPTLPRKS